MMTTGSCGAGSGLGATAQEKMAKKLKRKSICVAFRGEIGVTYGGRAERCAERIKKYVIYCT
jgi:hypothetical protein